MGDQVRENMDVGFVHEAQEVDEELELLHLEIVNILLAPEIEHLVLLLRDFGHDRIGEETKFRHHVEVVGSLAYRLVEAPLRQHVFNRFSFLGTLRLLRLGESTGVEDEFHEVLHCALVLLRADCVLVDHGDDAL